MPSLVKKHSTSFTANDSNIKKDTRLDNNKLNQTALDHLQRQIVAELTQEIRKCNISRCNTSNTSDNIFSLKSNVKTPECEINLLSRDL